MVAKTRCMAASEPESKYHPTDALVPSTPEG
jgi:hypothetical protein